MERIECLSNLGALLRWRSRVGHRRHFIPVRLVAVLRTKALVRPFGHRQDGKTEEAEFEDLNFWKKGNR